MCLASPALPHITALALTHHRHPFTIALQSYTDLDPEFYDAWQQRYIDAKTSLDDRDDKVGAARARVGWGAAVVLGGGGGSTKVGVLQQHCFEAEAILELHTNKAAAACCPFGRRRGNTAGSQGPRGRSGGLSVG